MKTLVRCLIIAIVAAAFFAITQHRQINTARAEVERLEARQRVPVANAVPAIRTSTVLAEDIERLRKENRDIHKLRGEISQAREKRRAIEKMQAENTQLRKRIAEVKANPYAAKTDPFPLSNKGQSTPEAAVETLFWSMYQGDIESLSRLMPMITREFEKMPAEERTNNITLLRAMASRIARFEITDRNFPSPDEAHIEVRIGHREQNAEVPVLGPNRQTFVLRKSNDVWQIVSGL
jgi:hypothetical protein